MAKDPAVLFYTSDFLTGTMTMNNEQVGMYMRLLCLQHQKGHVTEKDILTICGGKDEEVLSKFELIDGVYINARMQAESDKRKKYSDSRRKNRENKTCDKDMNNISETCVEDMENENENIGIKEECRETIKGESDESETEPDGFKEFWDLYDKKVSYQKSLKLWKKLKKADKQAILAKLPDYIASKPDKQFRKNPDTFLRNRSWEDEIPTKPPDKTVEVESRMAYQLKGQNRTAIKINGAWYDELTKEKLNF